MSAAVIAAGALVGAVALPASATDHRPHYRPEVKISAVQYDAPGRDDRSRHSLNKEWVELTNTTRHDVNLDGWTLRNTEGRTYTFHHYRLEARATVRVHTGEGRDTRTDVYQDRNREVWDNRSDTATLRNDRGRFVDDESWNRNRHHGGNRYDDNRHGNRYDDNRHGNRHDGGRYDDNRHGNRHDDDRHGDRH
ncbi:lamin tail domain-containing protein [Streptomyces sp. NBC_00267]|uniref:lamin tail domain-containing protein n=1 Tax=unclassified Streptomyces TaxID=2593676 RepID=UPI003FA794C9